VKVNDADTVARIEVEAKGTNARLASHVPQLLAGTPENNHVDAQGIQAYYTGLIARAAKLTLSVATSADLVRLEACPATANALASA
ncbi:MAG: histidine phosphotransferase family protein, partial [Methylovirgula sp.]